MLSNKHNLFKNKTGDQAFATALIFWCLLKDKALPAANRVRDDAWRNPLTVQEDLNFLT